MNEVASVLSWKAFLGIPGALDLYQTARDEISSDWTVYRILYCVYPKRSNNGLHLVLQDADDRVYRVFIPRIRYWNRLNLKTQYFDLLHSVVSISLRWNGSYIELKQ